METDVEPKEERKDRRKVVLKTLKLLFWSLFRFRFYLPGIPEITVEQLHERLTSGDQLFLIDLRDDSELEKDGYIENSQVFPYFDFPSYIGDLPKDKEIITICPGGGASLVGAEILINAGFPKSNVKSLKGGIRKWKKKGFPLLEFKSTSESKSKSIEERNLALKGKQFLNGDEMVEVHQSLDVRNLSCPIPVLESKKAIRKLKIGQVLEIMTTDPGSLRDIPAWAKNTNQEFISYKDDEKEYRFLVRRLS
ncbi:MAG: sulfurtransferase TusA family protein [Candidatus Hodarchaeales archaeon]|jgi:tRNA 2-thiouridine synthesizing protein A